MKHLFALLQKFDVLKSNTLPLIEALDVLTKFNLIKSSENRTLQKRFFFLRTVLLPISLSKKLEYYTINLKCSKKNILKIIKEIKNNETKLISIICNGCYSELCNFYTQLFSNTVFFKSKFNTKQFFIFLSYFRTKGLLNPTKYQTIRKKVLRAKREYIPGKFEGDHFPPDDLYFFARDPHIRNMKPQLRPVWNLLRSKHRRAISTGRGHAKNAFRIKQRNLFSQGQYSEAIENYLRKYLDNNIITKNNFHEIKNAIHKCSLVGLISADDRKKFLDIIEPRDS